MSGGKWLALAGALALAAGGVWSYQYLGAEDPLEKVQQMRAELMSESAANLSPEERRQKWEEFRREADKLTPEQRDSLWDEQRQRFQQRIDHFFTLSAEEQVLYLDAEIDRWEARRQEWAQRRAAGEASNRRPGGEATTTGDGQVSAERASPNTSTSDPEAAENRRRAWLDRTTPQQRARFAEYMRRMSERRRERGLSGGGFFGP